jgi:hypothetical protein
MGVLLPVASISDAPAWILPLPLLHVSGGLEIDESASFFWYFRFKMNAPAATSAMRARPPITPPTIAPIGVEDFFPSSRRGDPELDDVAGAPTAVEDDEIVEEELVVSL